MKAVKTWTPTKVSGLYRHASGTYYARVVVARKRSWRTLKTKVFEVAKVEHAKLDDEIKQKNELSCEVTLKEHMTGGQAMAIRRKQFESNPTIKKTTKHYLGQIAEMLIKSWPELKSKELRKITIEECEKWAGDTARKISAPRFNAALSMLRSLFEIGIARGARRTNPAAKLKRMRVKFKDLSTRLPSRSDFNKWVTTIRTAGGRFSEHCADFVEFLAFTGVRIGEAKWIEWRHCDFERGEILVVGNPDDGTKNHEFRRIPMVSAARQLLERLRKENATAKPNQRVLHVTMAKKAMDRAALEAEIARFTHHDLRHFFATICIESGVDIPTVAKWMGHKDGGALAMKVYGHLRNEHSLAAATRVSFTA